MTMNAGSVPIGHWVNDRLLGGGRIIGEACHYIDLARFLANSKIDEFSAVGIKDESKSHLPVDTASISLNFQDGSIAAINYISCGSKSYPKEKIEVFCQGFVLQLDNFRSLKGFGLSGFKRISLWRQNKGNSECVAAFLGSVRNNRPSPISFEEILEVSKVSIQIEICWTVCKHSDFLIF